MYIIFGEILIFLNQGPHRFLLLPIFLLPGGGVYPSPTLPKFNKSPLKNDGWKTTFFLLVFCNNFSGVNSLWNFNWVTPKNITKGRMLRQLDTRLLVKYPSAWQIPGLAPGLPEDFVTGICRCLAKLKMAFQPRYTRQIWGIFMPWYNLCIYIYNT